MHAKMVPTRFWDYGVEWVCDIAQIELLTGETPDISEFLDFGFYDWVFFKENAGLGPEALGRYLGVSH
jgi:hypothetical protein